MRPSVQKTIVLTFVSLLLCGLWISPALSAALPVVEPLGQLREGLMVPSRVDLDDAGNLYVTDLRRRAVVCFDSYGSLIRLIETVRPSGGGLAVTPDGQRLYVACGTSVAILEAETGKLLGYLGKGAEEFGAAGFIDLDSRGDVFVADTQARLVKKYGPSGEFLTKFGDPASASGTFASLSALAITPSGTEVFVADSMYSGHSDPKLAVFDLEGTWLRNHSVEVGFGLPVLAFWGGMAFDDSQRLYALDLSRPVICLFSAADTYIGSYPIPSAGGGHLVRHLVRHLDAAYDPGTHRLFVASDNGQIDIYGIDGGRNPGSAQTNSAPTPPVPSRPATGSEVATVRPELVFQNAADADNDPLSYEVELSLGQQKVAGYGDIPETAEASRLQIDSPLQENAGYGWTVRASDGKESSPWSLRQSFFVNAMEEPPLPPALKVADETIVDGGAILAWEDAVDPDPLDTILGYRVEVARDRDFTDLVLRETTSTAQLMLSSCTGYSGLMDGNSYFWRVTAVDNHELVSPPSAVASFIYDTTGVEISATLPGARVYLSGNHGYPGIFVGEAPLTLRDLAAAPLSIIVERAGFEPYVTQIRPAPRENLAVHAELIPAVKPEKPKRSILKAGPGAMEVGGSAVPFVVDFDNDGLIDVLSGDAAGALTLFRGTGLEDGTPAFAPGRTLDLPCIYGASPFVADWDRDGRKDLLVGGGDGTVTLFLNTGSEEAPAFGDGSYLQAEGVPISVEGAAFPAVTDFDGDGFPDLVTGSSSGSLSLFRHAGAQDNSSLEAPVFLLTASGPVAPFFVDWNGDGRRELLLATGDGFFQTRKNGDGDLVLGAPLFEIPFSKLTREGEPSWSRFFALDANGEQGKDLVVGNAAGQILLLRSRGKEPVEAFYEALQAKVDQLARLITGQDAKLSNLVIKLKRAVDSGNLQRGARVARELQARLGKRVEAATTAKELEGLLRR